jgi:NADPH2:quinone reductase
VLAVRVHRWGSPPEVEDVEDPRPRPGLAVVQVAAAAVGHVDRDIMRGGFIRHPPLPYIPGVEGAGTVVTSGRRSAGAPVWFRGAGLGTVRDGTWAELAVVSEDAIMPVPEGVAMATAATFFSPATSAYAALHEVGEVRRDERLAVRGAAGAVGSLTVQLALRCGVRKIVGIVSSAERVPLVPAGIDVLVGTGAEVAEKLREGQNGVDVLIDTVGGPDLAEMIEGVAVGGRLVLVGYTAGTSTEIDLSRLMQRDVRLLPLNMIRREASARAVAAELLGLLGEGQLTLEVTTMPLRAVRSALQTLAGGAARGRIALEP